MKLDYLITGTGRCGTVYLARCLTNWGIPCGHEAIFDYQGLRGAIRRLNGEIPVSLSVASKMEWTPENVVYHDDYVDPNKIRADSSYMAAIDLDAEILERTKIIHVVRHPVKVIHSFVNHIDYFKNEDHSKTYESFIKRNVPILKENAPAYDNASLFYIFWNELIEPHADLFVRIEDSLKPVQDFLNVSGDPFPNKTVNTFKKPVSEHFDIMDVEDKNTRDLLVAKGEQYGYDMTSKYFLV